MDLKERLQKILKERYGIENDADFAKELRNFQEVDFGIFVNPLEKEDTKSA